MTMAHPQNSPRGSFIKASSIGIDDQTVSGNTTGVTIEDGLALGDQTDFMTQDASGVKFPKGVAISAQTGYITQTATYVKLPTGLSLSAKTSYMTQNSTAVVLPTGLALSGKSVYFTANSTATVIVPTVSSLPAARVVGGLVFVSNSTGKSLAFHSTGTTWVYTSKTSVLA
jgi:virulence-associated protein VagC